MNTLHSHHPAGCEARRMPASPSIVNLIMRPFVFLCILSCVWVLLATSGNYNCTYEASGKVAYPSPAVNCALNSDSTDCLAGQNGTDCKYVAQKHECFWPGQSHCDDSSSGNCTGTNVDTYTCQYIVGTGSKLASCPCMSSQ